MKKYLFSALALGLVLTSCQSDEPFAPGEGGEKQVTFTINVPGELGTRAGATDNASDKGGFSNEQGTLSYTLVLTANNDSQVLTATREDKNVVFTPTVVLGRNYTVTAYAYFGDTAKSSLDAIAESKGINDESKDAYTWTGNINFATDGTEQNLTLTRPYGKLRLIATDYDAAKTDVKSVTVEYKNQMYTMFNAVEGQFNTEKSVSFTNEWNKDYYETATTDGSKTIFADYVPVNETGYAPFKVTVEYQNGETYTRSFSEDIPVKRNGLTTLRGNFFTAGAEITVNVDENFDGGQTVRYYSGVTIGDTNYDSLEEAVAAAQSGDVLRLDGDVVLVYNATRANENENFLIEINKNVTIDLNGKNINATVGDVTKNSGIFRVVNGGELTIEGNGNVDVTTGKAPGLTTFISNEGGVVNLKGGNWILEALNYPDALIPCFVDNNSTLGASTLNIFGGSYTFYRNLFRNFANHQTEVATINISGGTFNGELDDAGAIWNQKPSTNVPDGAGVINVTGGVFNNVVIDDDFGKVSNAKDQTELNSKVAIANATIQLKAGKYTFPSTFAEGVTLVCEEGVVFEGKSGLNIKGATVIGATFSNPGETVVGGTINGVFKDCKFIGGNALRYTYAGETVEFDNCVFDGNLYGIHFDGGENDAIFRNCTISGFNALGSALTMVTFENCTFKGNDKSVYNGANLWGSAKMINCEFTFDGTTSTEWIDCIGKEKTYEFKNCTVNGVVYTPYNYADFSNIFSRNKVIVTINGEECAMQ